MSVGQLLQEGSPVLLQLTVHCQCHCLHRLQHPVHGCCRRQPHLQSAELKCNTIAPGFYKGLVVCGSGGIRGREKVAGGSGGCTNAQQQVACMSTSRLVAAAAAAAIWDTTNGVQVVVCACGVALGARFPITRACVCAITHLFTAPDSLKGCLHG